MRTHRQPTGKTNRFTQRQPLAVFNNYQPPKKQNIQVTLQRTSEKYATNVCLHCSHMHIRMCCIDANEEFDYAIFKNEVDQPYQVTVEKDNFNERLEQITPKRFTKQITRQFTVEKDDINERLEQITPNRFSHQTKRQFAFEKENERFERLTQKRFSYQMTKLSDLIDSIIGLS